MSGTSEGARKAVETTRLRYSEEERKQWAALGSKMRKSNKGGLCDEAKRHKIASMGGRKGFKTRTITPQTELRPDEWGELSRLVNLTLEDLLMHSSEAERKQEIGETFNRFFVSRRLNDWFNGIYTWNDREEFVPQLGKTISVAENHYRYRSEGTPRNSKERNMFRIHRNLKAAYKVAVEGHNETRA